MSSLTKTQREESVDLKIVKTSDELNLKIRKLINQLNNSLIDLKIIIEEIKRLEKKD